MSLARDKGSVQAVPAPCAEAAGEACWGPGVLGCTALPLRAPALLPEGLRGDQEQSVAVLPERRE